MEQTSAFIEEAINLTILSSRACPFPGSAIESLSLCSKTLECTPFCERGILFILSPTQMCRAMFGLPVLDTFCL